MARKLLVDGDIILYRFAWSGHQKVDWGNGVLSEWDDVDGTLSQVDAFIEGLRKKTRAGDMTLYFTGSDIFRYEVLESYKHNRRGKDKPTLYPVIKDYLRENYPWYSHPKLEADDLLGIYGSGDPDNTLITSIDKDLKQIPGWHFNWDRDQKPRFVSLEEADRWFYVQTLTGDPTDGFAGLPGIGPVKAGKILDKAEDGNYWPVIREAYEKAGMGEGYALIMARMARILRAGEFDFATDQVTLWTPPEIKPPCEVKPRRGAKGRSRSRRSPK